MLAPWKESYDKPRQYIKKQRNYFAYKGPHSQSYGFSSSWVWMWELDHKEEWVLKSWCLRIVVKTPESPLDWKKIKPVNPKRNQPWIFIGRTDGKAKAPILWPPDAKRWLIKETIPMLGKTEGKRRRGWQRMQWLDSFTDGHEFEQTPKDSEVQGSLVCCSPWGHKNLDMT